MSGGVAWNAEAMMPEIRAGVMRGLVSWGGRIQEEGTRLILETTKGGRIYRRRGVEHQASAGGEPPASDTGRLVNSSRVDAFEGSLSVRINWSTAYAAWLQFGTEKMEPRPWADVALANVRDMGLGDIRGELKAVLE